MHRQAPIQRLTPLKRSVTPIVRRTRLRTRRPGRMATLLRTADRLWGLLVIDHALGMCEACWLLEGVRRPATDPAHVLRRGYMGTRHLPANGVALCRRHHEEFGSATLGKPSRMGTFYQELRGRLSYACLERLALKVTHFDVVTVEYLRKQAGALGLVRSR